MKNNSLPSISFLMPSHGRVAAGGYKVVYEYANRLVEKGYRVSVIYPLTLNLKGVPILKRIKRVCGLPKSMFKGKSCKKWFALDRRVKERWVLSLNEIHVPDADIFVATAVETAYYLKDYHRPPEKSIYMIQGFEDWGMSKEEVIASYGFGFHNIAVSNWLERIITDSGNDCVVLKNGYDFDYFKYLISVHDRENYSLTMMYGNHPSKGSEEGFQTISILKQKYPKMKVRVFSKIPRPDWIASWIEYYQLPDKDTHNFIYNSSAVYFAPSRFEGWGLPVGEAMMCGCAVVCTDNPGFREMVEPGKNGLMVAVGDVAGMVEKVSELFENPSKRIEMAESGLKSIQSFTWDKSVRQFLDLIEEISNQP